MTIPLALLYMSAIIFVGTFLFVLVDGSNQIPASPWSSSAHSSALGEWQSWRNYSVPQWRWVLEH